MKIDVVASEAHYLAHMVPIWAALPKELQGMVYPLQQQPVTKPQFGHIAMVAGWQDVHPLRGRCSMIYVEHGAGQTYSDAPDQPAYSGSGGVRHNGVIGYIAPSQKVADRWTNAPAVAVGCPKMDAYLLEAKPFDPSKANPTVCFAWHWECTIVPETRSAWPHYASRLYGIADRFRQQGFRVTGHEHPKWRGLLANTMGNNGIEILHTDRQVFNDVDILVVDNSSLAYEFASLGKPVLLLNAPWYRRDVEHGLRFWEFPPGLEINEPDELEAFNLWNLLHDTPDGLVSEFRRAAAVKHAYATTDGTSAERAAQWITSLLSRV